VLDGKEDGMAVAAAAAPTMALFTSSVKSD